MESDWRWNVIEQGWDSWWASPSYESTTNVLALAFLITPVVIFGKTYTGLMRIHQDNLFKTFYVMTSLSPMRTPFNNFGPLVLPGPFPHGIPVLPDHP